MSAMRIATAPASPLHTMPGLVPRDRRAWHGDAAASRLGAAITLAGMGATAAYLVALPKGMLGLGLALLGGLGLATRVPRLALAAYLLVWGPPLLGGLFRCFGLEQVGTLAAYGGAASLLALIWRQVPAAPPRLRAGLGWWLFTGVVLWVAYLLGPMSAYCTGKLIFFGIYLTAAAVAFHCLNRAGEIDLLALGVFAVAGAAVHYASIGYRIPDMMPASVFVPTGMRLAMRYREDALPETNVLAYLACSATLMVLAALVDKRAHGLRLLVAIVMMSLGALIVFSVGQRAWMLALGAGVLSTLFCRPRNAAAMRVVNGLMLGLCLLLMIVAVVMGSRLITPIYEGLRDGSDRFSALVDRDRNWDAALRRIEERPLLGHGLGGYYVDGYSNPGEGTYAHNVLLELLSETGLIGTALILLPPLLFFVGPGWKAVLRQRTVSGASPLPLVVMYALFCMISWDLKFHAHLFALLGTLWMAQRAAGHELPWRAPRGLAARSATP